MKSMRFKNYIHEIMSLPKREGELVHPVKVLADKPDAQI